MRYFRIRIGMHFTRWYVRRGYTFDYEDHKPVWDCPWYIRPMLFFFSPVIYFTYVIALTEKKDGKGVNT